MAGASTDWACTDVTASPNAAIMDSRLNIIFPL
jgi:hypothetical protein